MITLLDKKRSVIGNVRNSDEATLDQVLSRISALAPVVAQCARDMEHDRRLPKELVSALKSARIYSMLVPRRYCGLELDAPSAFRAISALAKLDGSVGWNAMTGNLGSSGMLDVSGMEPRWSPHLPRFAVCRLQRFLKSLTLNPVSPASMLGGRGG